MQKRTPTTTKNTNSQAAATPATESSMPTQTLAPPPLQFQSNPTTESQRQTPTPFTPTTTGLSTNTPAQNVGAFQSDFSNANNRNTETHTNFNGLANPEQNSGLDNQGAESATENIVSTPQTTDEGVGEGISESSLEEKMLEEEQPDGLEEAANKGEEAIADTEKGGEAVEKSEGQEVADANNPQVAPQGNQGQENGEKSEGQEEKTANESSKAAKGAASPADEKGGNEEGKLNESKGQLVNADGQLSTANARLAGIAGKKVKFKKPEDSGAVVQKKSANGDGLSWDARNDIAQNQINTFVGNSLSKINQINQFAEALPAQIQLAAANAKAQIQAALGSQIAATQSNTGRLMGLAAAQKATSIADINAAHQASASNISATATGAITQLATDFSNANTRLDSLETTQLAALESSYAATQLKYREVGTTVGQEAVNKAASIAQGHDASAQAEREKGHSWKDGPYKRKRYEARAKIARDVGAAYQEDLIKQANEQAESVVSGKEKDVQNIQAQINDYRNLLLQQFETNHQVILDVETQLLNELETQKTNNLTAAEAIYEGSVQELQAAEVQIINGLKNHAKTQEAVVDSTAQQIAATLKSNAAQLIDGLTEAVHRFLNSIDDSPLPETSLLAAMLGQTSNALDGIIAKGIGSMNTVVAKGTEASFGMASQTSTSLELLGDRGRSEAELHIITNGLTVQLETLQTGATQLFSNIEKSFTDTADVITKESGTSFDTTVTSLEEYFSTANDAMSKHFIESADLMEQAFRDAILHPQDGLAATAKRMGDEKADSIQPRWKSVLAIVIAIVVVVVIILVAGPAIIAAAGAFAGAIGATGLAATIVSGAVAGAAIGAIAGPITTAATNLLMDKPWHEGVVDSIWKGALTGAIGGAVGGAVSHGINAAFSGMGAGLSRTVLQKGTELVADIGQDFITSVITGQEFNIFESIAMSIASGAAMSKVETRTDTSSPDYDPTSWSARTAEVGREFGTDVGNWVDANVPGIGPKVEVETPNTAPDLDNTPKPEIERTNTPDTDNTPIVEIEKTNTPDADNTPKVEEVIPPSKTPEVETTTNSRLTASEKAAVQGLPEAPPGYHYNQTKNGDIYIKRTSSVDADGNMVAPMEIKNGELVYKDPSTYLPPEVIAEHLAKFEDGAGYFVPKDVLDTYGRDPIGRPDGQFITTRAELERVVREANGDVAKLEKLLGIPEGSWQGREIVRIELDANALKEHNLRMATGNEDGANELWIPGGKTIEGVDEAVINQIPEGSYREVPAFEVKKSADETGATTAVTPKEDFAIRAENLDLEGGHSWADHGAHTTEAQHQHRLKTGETPGGSTRRIPDNSSKFVSDEMHIKAYEDALVRLETEKINTRGGLKRKVELKRIPLPDCGINYKLDDAGNLVQSKIDSYTAIFRLDPSTGTYSLITQFPQ